MEEAGRASAVDFDAASTEAALVDCYDDIRRVARSVLAGDGMARVVQATELAHEAILRLIKAKGFELQGRAHLLATAARAMRRILIDEARKAAAGKRQPPVFHTLWPDEASHSAVNVDDLERAMEALSEYSAEHAEIVELRFMLGLTVEETSRATGIPERTVKRRWQAARAWLLEYFDDDAAAQKS
ncbi:MAG: ECF-type sigma factor [Parvularculaceae bacterium]